MSARVAIPLLALLIVPASAFAEGSPQTVEIASGAYVLTAPEDWKAVPPRSRMLEHELSLPAPEGSEAVAGRLTIMAAGGSVDANISRWIGQFQGTEGGANREGATIDQETVAGMPVTLFDHSGTYMESTGGPFGPKTPREDYRMLAAIIETGATGTYFIKLTGPAETLDPAAEPFRDMVLGITQQ